MYPWFNPRAPSTAVTARSPSASSLHLSDCSLHYSVAPANLVMEATADYTNIVEGSPTSQPSLQIGDPVTLGGDAPAGSSAKVSLPVDVAAESPSVGKEKAEIETQEADDAAIIAKGKGRPTRRTLLLVALLVGSVVALLALVAAVVVVLVFVVAPALAADPPPLPDPMAQFRLPVCQEQFSEEQPSAAQCPAYVTREAFMM